MTSAGRKADPYALASPCSNCPFRTDVPPYLTHDRAAEIARSLTESGDFPCHKTTVEVDDGDGGETLAAGPQSKQCAGALIVCEKSGIAGQTTRVAERLGLYDRTRLDMTAPVHESLSAWVASYATDPLPFAVDRDGEKVEFEHCGVVADGCEDPAGFAYGGGALANSDEPMCNPLTDTCEACGNAACEACRSEDSPAGSVLCVYCAQDEDDREG